MKNSRLILTAAAGVLALAAAFNLRHGPSVEASSTGSPDAAAARAETPQNQAWRQFARTTADAREERTAPHTAPKPPPFAAWGGPVSGDRVQKLFELAGIERWPAIIPPANGDTFTDEDVLRNYPFLRGADGSYDAAFVAKVRDVLQRLRDADTKPKANPYDTPSREPFRELRALIGPVIGWTEDRRGTPVPTEEFAAIVPQIRDAQQLQVRHLIESLALAQTAQERRPDLERYVQDVVRVTERNARIALSADQAARLLATPLERLVVNGARAGG